MSAFLDKQQKFALAIAGLIVHAHEIGLPVTVGDAFRDPRLHGAMGVAKGYGAKNSCHKLRLAVDLNLVINGELAAPEAYAPLHDYWETVGGSKRIADDMNHFSFAHDGFR
jgi:hypothetical protein